MTRFMFSLLILIKISIMFFFLPSNQIGVETIVDWVGVSWINEETYCDHMMAWFVRMTWRCSKMSTCVIWFAVCWCIWWSRNPIIFNNEITDPVVIVQRIIIFLWWWLPIGLNHRIKCNYYEWCKCPIDFL